MLDRSTPRLARPMSFAGFALLALVTFGMAAPAEPRWSGPGGLEGRWRLDEGSGTSAADSSGNANTGTLNNGVAWVSGKSGSALSLDGVDDYVSCGVTGMPAANASQTMAWWANYASVPSGVGTMIDLHNDASSSGVQTGFRSGQLTVWNHGGGTLAQAAAPSTGAWHHFAYSFDGTTHKLYVDGAQANTSTAAPQTAVPTTLVFGRWNGGAQEYYAGKLDEVRIYSRTLSASEVALLAHDPALEAYWKLDEGTGTSTADATADQYNGTLTNGPTWVAGQVGQAVQFDGTNDYISLGSNLNILRNVPAATLMGRVKINTLPANGASMEMVSFSINSGSATSSSRARIKVIGTGTAANLVGGGRSTDSEGLQDLQDTSTALSAGTWYHVAGVIDYTGKTVKLYVNGSQVASATKSFASNTTPDTASTSNALGSEEDGSAGFLNGILDDVRVYSRALSADEIAGLAGGNGTGLSAVYYDNMDFTGSFVQQTDATINFNWGSGAPTTGIGADTFSVLWTGQVQPQYSETYTFYTNTDDGARLWVNGQLIVDFPVNQSVTEHSGSITLSGGVKYDLRMEYFENTGDAQAELRWSSGSTPKAIIPQSQLYPTDSVTPALLNATSATGDLTHVYLRYNEAMHVATATATGNYTLSGGLTVSAAAISTDKKVVTLTASGNVTIGTTTVTASASIKNLEQEAIAQTTKTIVAGNGQGIPDSTAITLTMTTDGNHSAVMFNEPSSHGVPQGIGETLKVIVQGTSATTVTLRQMKKLGGTGQVFFGQSGSDTSVTFTTPGGTDNDAYIVVRHGKTSAFEGDDTIEAIASGDVRATKDVTAVQVDISPKYGHVSDQVPVTATAQVTPAFQGLQFKNTTYLLDFGKTDGTTQTTLLAMPGWSATNSSGAATRQLVPQGLNQFLYDATQLQQPTNIQGTVVESPRVCEKKKEDQPKHGSGNPQSIQGKADSMSICPAPAKKDKGWVATGGGASKGSIDPVDGEKKLIYTDLAIPGRGLDFEFGRSYRSSDYRAPIAQAGAKVVREFGVCWTYSYADDYLLKDGNSADDSSSFVNYRAGQSGNVYINTGIGKWSAGQDDFFQFRNNPSSGDLEVREENGTLRIYNNFATGTTPNKNGRLKALEDRNGNRMAFFYEQIDPDNTVSGDEKYVLAYVIDTMGREIRYQYYAKTAQTISGRQVTLASTNMGAYGRLAKVMDWKDNVTFSGSPSQTQDFPGQVRNRSLVFNYDSEGNLVRATTPAIGGTPNGNNFSIGCTLRYRYYTSTQHPAFSQTQWDALTSSQKDRLLHKLTHIWYPNEVKDNADTDPADADAAEVVGYETNTSSRYYGFVTTYAVGGTNGNGVPAGGTLSYTYTDLNPGRGVDGFPYNFFLVPSLKVAVTDRNGNQAEYVFTAEKTMASYSVFTKGLRAGEPTTFVQQYSTNGNALLRGDRLLTGRTGPEGDSLDIMYNDSSSDRFQQGNVTRQIWRPDAARGGDQTKIEKVILYDPFFNQPSLLIDARGADVANNGFTPPIADPASRTITDPYDSSKTLNLRYSQVYYFDYQESTLASTAWSATSSFTPTTVDSVNVKATEVLLLRKSGLPDTNDTDRTNSVREVRNRLSANLIKLGLGDLNGDGVTDPVASGNVIRTAFGSPVLIANTNQHKLEGDIESAGDLIDQSKNVVDGGTQEGTNGARLQTIVWMYQYNSFGQVIKMISPEGNVTSYSYFAENDPDGDSVTTPTPADGRTLSTTTGGYLKEYLRDTTRSYYQQTTGTLLTGAFSNNNFNPTATDINIAFAYDDVGNTIRITNGRGVRTDYFVSELNRVLQITRAADISAASTASPADPLYNHFDTQQRLTAFAYKSRASFDYNGNVVLVQVEDRGNTSSADGSGLGSLPSEATSSTPGLSTADSSGGDAFIDELYLYDRMNSVIEKRSEVDSTRSLVSKVRYDGNGHPVLFIKPSGNADGAVYDERDLLFQAVRGVSTRPSAGKYAAGDPTTFNRPGGSGTVASSTTLNYDKDRNVVEIVDAGDTDANSANNSSVAGSGDVVAKYTYDGFNRQKSMTNALGNKATYLYDPDNNIVRVIRDGDPVDDLVGSSENKTLAVTEYIYDELSRPVCTHLVLFQTPDATPSRVPVLTDTAAMDSLAVYLSDASSDTASVPGTTGITVIGRITRISEYDRESRRTFRIQDDLNVGRVDFDGAGRVVKWIDDALSNGFVSGAYNPASISGNVVELAYDDYGNVIEVKETDVTTVANVAAEIFRTTYLYDSLDRLQTRVDNIGLAADYRYDSRDNSVSASDPVGSVTSRSFNRRGLGSTSAVTINNYGNVRRYTMDGQSRLLEMEVRLTGSAQGDGTNIGATLEGVKTTAPTVDTAQSGDGLISSYYAYSDNSQLLAFRDDDGNTTAYIYDNQDRALVERKGLALTGTTFSISGGESGAFNVSLRGGVSPVDSESAGTDETWSYDVDSNVTAHMDEAGNQFTFTYDALNRKKTCSITAATGFIGTSGTNCLTWKYDGLSRITECFDGNDPSTTSDDIVCTLFYDSLSRKVEEAQKIGSLSAKAISYSYDLDCVCGAEARPNHTIYPDGRDLHTFYDTLDRVLYRNDVVGGTSYSNIGEYQYIGKTRVAVLTYQNNIRLTHIGQVSSQNADTGFDGDRRIVNHRWESFTTEALGAGTLVMGFEHEDGNTTPGSMYDRANNKRIEYKTHDPGNSEQYKYDSAYRLTSPGSGSQGVDARGFERGTFTNANRTSMSGGVTFYQDWDLEGLGNWSRQDDNARVETRTHSDFNEVVDRVVSGNTATLAHDKNGNTTDTGYTSLGGQNFPGGGLRMEWDALGRLRKVYKNSNTPGSTGDDILVAEYVYDYQNRRLRKIVTNSGGLNGTTDFYYDGWRVIEEHDGSDAITNQYTYGNYVDEVWTLDNRRSGGTIANLNDNSGVLRHFYLSNTMYHVCGLTNEGSSTTPGTLKEAYQYDAYGKQTVITDGNDGDAVVNFSANDVRITGGASSINGSPYMYTGQRFDAETGLLYFRNRYLSADLGRFISRDPLFIVAIENPNLYAYVNSGPTNGVDPLGLQPQPSPQPGNTSPPTTSGGAGPKVTGTSESLKIVTQVNATVTCTSKITTSVVGTGDPTTKRQDPKECAVSTKAGDTVVEAKVKPFETTVTTEWKVTTKLTENITLWTGEAWLKGIDNRATLSGGGRFSSDGLTMGGTVTSSPEGLTYGGSAGYGLPGSTVGLPGTFTGTGTVTYGPKRWGAEGSFGWKSDTCEFKFTYTHEYEKTDIFKIELVFPF